MPDAGGDDPGGESEHVRVLVKQLDGGYRLGVGEDLEQVGELEDTIFSASWGPRSASC